MKQIFINTFAKDKHTLKTASCLFECLDFSTKENLYNTIVEHPFYDQLEDINEIKTRFFINYVFK